MGFVRYFVKILFIIELLFSTQAFAQNVQRIEEEAIKDKEREVKIQEYIKRREEGEKLLLAAPISFDELQVQNLVEVESNNILPSDLVSYYALVPYKVRRPRWGHMFAVTYSQFNPINYESDYAAIGLSNFENLYSSSNMIELSYTYKWNFQLGSLGGEIAYGTYSSDAVDTLTIGSANLNLQVVRFGAKYIADNFMYEPIVAPYAIGGIYTVLYDESRPGASFNGTTGVAGYFGAGVLFQLSWLDKDAAVEAYTESGIENTYLFGEVRSYLSSAEEKDPDFSTDLDLNFGMSLEF